MLDKWIIASDIDNTLTGDDAALEVLSRKLAELRSGNKIFLILSTGRRLSQVISGFENEGLPRPDAVICQVGTEIYLPPFSESSRPIGSWNKMLTDEFSREEALEVINGIDGLRMQPEDFNTDLKLSFYLESREPEAVVEEIKRRLEAVLDPVPMVIWSSGRDLDVIPASSGKGKAIRHLAGISGMDMDRLVVAGDSGNDISMFETFRHGIIVGNAQDELKKYGEDNRRSELYLAARKCAAGVMEGLKYFGITD